MKKYFSPYRWRKTQLEFNSQSFHKRQRIRFIAAEELNLEKLRVLILAALEKLIVPIII